MANRNTVEDAPVQSGGKYTCFGRGDLGHSPTHFIHVLRNMYIVTHTDIPCMFTLICISI